MSASTPVSPSLSRRAVMAGGLTCLAAATGLTGCAGTVNPETPEGGVLAPQPLYRDPVFDGAADPCLIHDPARGLWVMFYTVRRANVAGLDGVSWVHGTPIGLAESRDGVHWRYAGTVDFPADLPGAGAQAGAATYWAPAVVAQDGVFHMFLTVVPGVFKDWNHPRRIVHLSSTDLRQWRYLDTLSLSSEKVIDPALLRLPDGSWRLWYNNEAAGKKIYFADSPDLLRWQDRGPALLSDQATHRGEAPLAFFWRGRYWLLIDLLRNDGLAAYRSDDGLHWTRQPGVLAQAPGRGRDDQNGAHHPEVVVHGDRAWLYYFVHPGVSADGSGRDERRTSLQVLELGLGADGWLLAPRDLPTRVALPPGGDARAAPRATR